jgi:hypothetical protein
MIRRIRAYFAEQAFHKAVRDMNLAYAYLELGKKMRVDITHNMSWARAEKAKVEKAYVKWMELRDD